MTGESSFFFNLSYPFNLAKSIFVVKLKTKSHCTLYTKDSSMVLSDKLAALQFNDNNLLI